MYDPQSLLNLDNIGPNLEATRQNELDLLYAVRSAAAIEIRKEVLQSDVQARGSKNHSITNTATTSNASDFILDVLLNNEEFFKRIELSHSVVKSHSLPGIDSFLTKNFQVAELVALDAAAAASQRAATTGNDFTLPYCIQHSFAYNGRTIHGNKFQLVEQLSHALYRTIQRRSQLEQGSFNVTFVQGAVSKVTMCLVVLMNAFEANSRAQFLLDGLFSSPFRQIRAIPPLEPPKISADRSSSSVTGTDVAVVSTSNFVIEFGDGTTIALVVTVRMVFVLEYATAPYLRDHSMTVLSPLLSSTPRKFKVTGSGVPDVNGTFELKGFQNQNGVYWNPSSGATMKSDQKHHCWEICRSNIVFYKTGPFEQQTIANIGLVASPNLCAWKVASKRGLKPVPQVNLIDSNQVHPATNELFEWLANSNQHPSKSSNRSNQHHSKSSNRSNQHPSKSSNHSNQQPASFPRSMNSSKLRDSNLQINADAVGLPIRPAWLVCTQENPSVLYSPRTGTIASKASNNNFSSVNLARRTTSSIHSFSGSCGVSVESLLNFRHAGNAVTGGCLEELAQARYTLQSFIQQIRQILAAKSRSPPTTPIRRNSSGTTMGPTKQSTTYPLDSMNSETNDLYSWGSDLSFMWSIWVSGRSTNFRCMYEKTQFASPCEMTAEPINPSIVIQTVAIPSETLLEHNLASLFVSASLLCGGTKVPGTSVIETERVMFTCGQANVARNVHTFHFSSTLCFPVNLHQVPLATKVSLILWGVSGSTHSPWSKSENKVKLAISVLPWYNDLHMLRTEPMVSRMWPATGATCDSVSDSSRSLNLPSAALATGSPIVSSEKNSSGSTDGPDSDNMIPPSHGGADSMKPTNSLRNRRRGSSGSKEQRRLLLSNSVGTPKQSMTILEYGPQVKHSFSSPGVSHKRKDSRRSMYNLLLNQALRGEAWTGQPVEHGDQLNCPRIVVSFQSTTPRLVHSSSLISMDRLRDSNFQEFCRKAKFLANLVDIGPIVAATVDIIQQQQRDGGKQGDQNSRGSPSSTKSALDETSERFVNTTGSKHRRHRSSEGIGGLFSGKLSPSSIEYKKRLVVLLKFVVSRTVRSVLYNRFIAQATFSQLFQKRCSEICEGQQVDSQLIDDSKSHILGPRWPHRSLPCPRISVAKKSTVENDVTESTDQSIELDKKAKKDKHKSSKTQRKMLLQTQTSPLQNRPLEYHPLSIEVDDVVTMSVEISQHVLQVLSTDSHNELASDTEATIVKSNKVNQIDSQRMSEGSGYYQTTQNNKGGDDGLSISTIMSGDGIPVEVHYWQTSSYIHNILAKPPEDLTKAERVFLFQNRESLISHSENLVHLVFATNWFDVAQVLEITRLLANWPTLSPSLAATMLAHPKVFDPIVRRFCVQSLYKYTLEMSDDVSIWMGVLQDDLRVGEVHTSSLHENSVDCLVALVTGLRLEPHHDSPLCRFILLLALQYQDTIGNRLIGLLQVVLDHALLDQQRYALLLETYILLSGEESDDPINQ